MGRLELLDELVRLQAERDEADRQAEKARGELRSAVQVAYFRDKVPASKIAAELGVSRQRVYALLGGK